MSEVFIKYISRATVRSRVERYLYELELVLVYAPWVPRAQTRGPYYIVKRDDTLVADGLTLHMLTERYPVIKPGEMFEL